MRSARLSLLALAFLGQTAVASDTRERLVLEPYPGDPPWQEVTNKASGDQWLREQIPADQKIDAYRDILTAQSFPQQKNTDPSSFLKGMFSRVGGACDGVRVNGPKEQQENGYSIAYAQVYCGKQKGTQFGVNMFFKVVKGADSLYVIQREFRVPPTEVGGVTTFNKAQMGQMMALMKAQSVANSYLANSVYVCGEQTSDKRCGSQRAQ